MSKVEILYSSDVNIEDHSDLVVYQEGEEITAIYICRDSDSTQIWVYFVEIFKKPADSWINEEDLKSINAFADMQYKFNEELGDPDKYLFTSDLCSYYGPANFDSIPNTYSDSEEFEKWLVVMGIIEGGQDG